MTPLATSYSTTPFSLPPQTTTTSLTYHLIRPIFSLSDGVLRRPVELAESKRPLAKKASKTGPLTNDLIKSLALEYDQPFTLLLSQPIYRVDSPRIWELATISLIAKKVRKLV